MDDGSQPTPRGRQQSLLARSPLAADTPMETVNSAYTAMTTQNDHDYSWLGNGEEISHPRQSASQIEMVQSQSQEDSCDLRFGIEIDDHPEAVYQKITQDNPLETTVLTSGSILCSDSLFQEDARSGLTKKALLPSKNRLLECTIVTPQVDDVVASHGSHLTSSQKSAKSAASTDILNSAFIQSGLQTTLKIADFQPISPKTTTGRGGSSQADLPTSALNVETGCDPQAECSNLTPDRSCLGNPIDPQHGTSRESDTELPNQAKHTEKQCDVKIEQENHLNYRVGHPRLEAQNSQLKTDSVLQTIPNAYRKHLYQPYAGPTHRPYRYNLENYKPRRSYYWQRPLYQRHPYQHGYQRPYCTPPQHTAPRAPMPRLPSSGPPSELDEAMSGVMRCWRSYLSTNKDEMQKHEVERAKQAGYNEQSLSMLEDKDNQVWQLIDKLGPQDDGMMNYVLGVNV